MASFHTFDSCTILKNSVCDGFLARLGHFHHCNLADFVYRTQVQTGIRVFYVQYSPKKLFKLWHENACNVSSKKSSELFFPYFVFSWYILVQSLVKRFPKWVYIFLFFYSEVAYICLNIYLFKQAATSLIYYEYLIFFYKNYWPHLASRSKYRKVWDMTK